jgi:multiple sugar transport system substrate-binding protein
MKWLVAFLAVLAAVSAWAVQDDPSGNTEPISYWTWQPSGEALAEDFGVQNAHRPVTVRRFGSGAELYQALLAALNDSGNEVPDAFRLEYAFLPLLRQQGAISSLEPWLSSRDAATAFPAWTLKQVSAGGALHAVPVDVGAVALVYRADLLERYGIALPTTLAQLGAAAQKLAGASKGAVKLLGVDWNNSLWWLAFSSATGSRAWTATADEAYTQRLDNAEARRLAGALQGIVARGQVLNLPSGSVEEARALRDGRVAMVLMPVSIAVSLTRVLRAPGAAKYRVAALPGGGSADWGGSACAVTTRSLHAAAATAFCRWLAENRGATTRSWTRDALLPVVTGTGLSQGEVNAFYGRQDVTDVYSRLAGRVQSQVWVPWLPLTDAVYRQLMRRVSSGELTLTEMLERWQMTVLAEARKAGYTVR